MISIIIAIWHTGWTCSVGELKYK